MRSLFLLWSRYNPTASLLRMKSFVARHDYIFSLLLLLNVNMDAFDITALCDDEDEDSPRRSPKALGSSPPDDHGIEAAAAVSPK